MNCIELLIWGEAIALRLEAIATRLEAIAIRFFNGRVPYHDLLQVL